MIQDLEPKKERVEPLENIVHGKYTESMSKRWHKATEHGSTDKE
jgi:hypothetical protein